MTSQSAFAEVAALAGDPARAGMLHALMDGRALTASELARVAGITPQTASGHLARLAVAGLLAVEKQGRHRYHRLASPAVAQMVEGIMQVASGLGATRPRLVVGPRDAALRAARTCYDHLAGRLGVALADALVEGGQIELASDGGMVTDAGIAFFSRIGIDLDGLRHPQRQALGSRSVSALPRLERAAPSYCRHDRRSPVRAQLWEGLDPPQQRHPRRHDHTQGTAGLPRRVSRTVGVVSCRIGVGRCRSASVAASRANDERGLTGNGKLSLT